MDFEGNHEFAKYQSFKLAGEAEKYKLALGAFVEGSTGESPRGARQWPGLQRGVWGSREDLLSLLALPTLCDVPGDLTSPVSYPHSEVILRTPKCTHKAGVTHDKVQQAMALLLTTITDEKRGRMII